MRMSSTGCKSPMTWTNKRGYCVLCQQRRRHPRSWQTAGAPKGFLIPHRTPLRPRCNQGGAATCRTGAPPKEGGQTPPSRIKNSRRKKHRGTTDEGRAESWACWRIGRSSGTSRSSRSPTAPIGRASSPTGSAATATTCASAGISRSSPTSTAPSSIPRTSTRRRSSTSRATTA